MPKNKPLMQVICEEEWVVNMGKKEFLLTKQQVRLLREVTTQGARGLVWFDKFAISIPHIVYVARRSRTYWKTDGRTRLKISSGEYEELRRKLPAETVKPAELEIAS